MNKQKGFIPKDIEHIKTNFPKAFSALGKYLFTPELQQVLREAGDKFVDKSPDLSNATATLTLLADARVLYDFFDDYAIEVYYNRQPGNSQLPYVVVIDTNNSIYSLGDCPYYSIPSIKMLKDNVYNTYENYSNRLQHELSAFMFAFEILEKQIE